MIDDCYVDIFTIRVEKVLAPISHGFTNINNQN